MTTSDAAYHDYSWDLPRLVHCRHHIIERKRIRIRRIVGLIAGLDEYEIRSNEGGAPNLK